MGERVKPESTERLCFLGEEVRGEQVRVSAANFAHRGVDEHDRHDTHREADE